MPDLEARLLGLLDATAVVPADWHVLERQVRTRTGYGGSAVQHVENLPQLGMATWHRDGHVRERALRQLDSVAAEQAAPFFLLRLHDWVEPIRLLADTWIAAHAGATLRWLPLVAAELGKERPTGAHWWPAIRKLLTQDPGLVIEAPSLVGHCLTQDTPGDAVAVWLRLPNLSARLKAARHVLQRADLEALRPHLWHDASPKIRALDLQWERALFDPSRLVRARAIFACKKAGEDPARLYRESGSEVALSGLAQCAEAQDVPLFEARLQGELPRQRVEALEALAPVAPELARRHARELLESDPSVRVRRAALGLLGSDLGEERIVEFAGGAPSGLRNDAWRLLRRHYPWQELLWLLRGDDAPRLRSWLVRFWRRSWMRPPAHLAAPLAAALAENSWLTESERQHLGFL